jgi:ubiquinone/menaquinone biosynthesis C-methylase UbiE
MMKVPPYPLTGESIPVLEDSETVLTLLIEQSDLFTRYEGGILPERDSLTGITNILDVGCGPGGWGLEVAKLHTEIEVVGVDISSRMIEDARSRAQRLGVHNIRFLEMDITKRLALEDGSFDLVNGRCLQGSLNTASWLPFVLEGKRVLRPGGTLRLTEAAFTESNSAVFNELYELLALAFYKNGYSFSTNGRGTSTGLAYMLPELMRNAGFHVIHSRGWTIDCSSKTDDYDALLQHVRITFSPYVLGTFICKTDLMSAQEYQQLYNRAMSAAASTSFQAMAYFLTVTGERPCE